MNKQRIINFVIACLVCVALWFIVPFMPVPKTISLQLIFGTLVIAVFMLTQLSISRWLASMMMRPLVALLILVGCMAVWLSVVSIVAAPYSRYETKYGQVALKIKKHPAPTVTEVTAQQSVKDKKGNVTYKPVKVQGKLKSSDIYFKLFVFSTSGGLWRGLSTLLMIIAASAFGCLASYILREPNILLPVAGMAAYIDIWAVYAGPVAKMLAKAPKVVEAVSVALPQIGSASSGFAAISFIGPADFIFFTMFLAAAYRLKLEPNRTFWIGFPLLTLGMSLVVASGYTSALGFLNGGLPALTLIGTTVVLANYKHFKLKKDEYVAIAVVGAILVAVLLFLTPIIRGK